MNKITRVLLFMPLLMCFGCGQKSNRAQDVRFEDVYPPVVQVAYEENNRIYYVEAIQGQVIVIFAENVSHTKALQVIREAGGQVVAQTPATHYYLVNTDAGMESEFINKVRTVTDIELVFPNSVSHPCAVMPYVMDNFKYELDGYKASHGEMVSSAMIQCGSGGYINEHDIGKKGEKSMVWSEIEHYLKEILYDASEENQPVINMSFGPSLDKDGKKWINVTDSVRDVYRLNYIKEIKYLLSMIKPYDDKEFIVVKAAGNDGVWDFEKEILNPLYNELDLEQRSMIDKHFLFATALDGNKKYSNVLKSGTNHNWVTKIDITDFKYNNIHVPGTSIAAPRAACFLISAAQKHNLKVTEVLQYARKVTEEDPNHILTPELLEKTISSEVIIEGVLRMYLLDNMGGSSVTYYTDAEGNVINAVGEEDPDNPYCQTIYEYRETDFENTYLAFVIEADNAINVIPYLEAGDDEFLDDSFQSAFMLVPQFQYNGKDFAEKYANKRVRAMGTLYVPGGGWRNATEVVMKLSNLELFDIRGFSDIKKSSASLVGTKWLKESQTTERLGVMFKSNRMEWEFLENGFVEITIFFDSGAKEINRVYKYYFDGESNHWMMWNWGAVEQIGRLEGETNETVLRERAYKQGLYYTLTLNGEKLFATDFSGYEQYDFTRMN